MYMNVNWLPEIVSKSDVSSVGGQFTLPTQLMILNYPESMNSCLIGWRESDDVTSVMTTIFWKGTLCIRLLSSIEQERNKQIIEYYQEIIALYYLLVLVSLVLWIIIIIVSVLCTSVLFKFQFCLFFFSPGLWKKTYGCLAFWMNSMRTEILWSPRFPKRFVNRTYIAFKFFSFFWCSSDDDESINKILLCNKSTTHIYDLVVSDSLERDH